MSAKKIIEKVVNKIAHLKAMSSSTNYIKYLRAKGVKVGEGTHIHQKSCLIDLTRPSLVTIGENVLINDNFTLLTHDFVSGVFRELYHDFIPSSGAVTIGNNVRFGHNVTILKGVTIGDNCFIGAGSLVSSDIPANSIASGNPCRVVSQLEQFYKYRQEACKPEAYLYAQSIVERYGRKPHPSDFWEEFPLFVDGSNMTDYPEIPFRKQLGNAYEHWKNTHKANFPSFEEFLLTALNYKPISQSSKISLNNGVIVAEETKIKVRNIVSRCTETKLSSSDDNLFMSDVEGWTSLTNMMILTEVEKSFGISILSDDLFEMTSVVAIARIVEKYTKENELSSFNYSDISSLYPYSPLWNAICKNVENNPSKIAIKIAGKSVTYSSLYENSCKSASILWNLGVRHGDKIILSAHKDIEYIYLYFASHIIGSTNVIVDAESNNERIEYIERKTQPKYCFGYKSKQFPSCEFSELNIDSADLLQKSDGSEQFTENEISEILFTTGTTGDPKGVCLSYANIYGSAANINEFIKNSFDDIELLGLPICHSFGMGRIRCCLLKGATIIILENFGNVQRMFKIIEEENITGFGVVPAAWAYIRKVSGKRIAQFANQIRYIEIGSAAMPLDVKKEMLEMFPKTRICMHYGLTEASRNCFIEFHDSAHIESIGLPVCDKVDVKIFSPDGLNMANYEKGEICVKGNMVLTRYLEDKDNVNAFFGDYFRTGDCGYIAEDGYIYLLGREKELINVGGKKVSPMEVEDVIMKLGVGDCVCVPMKDPDGVMGELVKCYILRGSTSLSFEQISEKIKGKLENYKRPVKYEWIDTIPQTVSGKKIRINL